MTTHLTIRFAQFNSNTKQIQSNLIRTNPIQFNPIRTEPNQQNQSNLPIHSLSIVDPILYEIFTKTNIVQTSFSATKPEPESKPEMQLTPPTNVPIGSHKQPMLFRLETC